MSYFPSNRLPSKGIKESLANGWGIFVLDVEHEVDFQPSAGLPGSLCKILRIEPLLVDTSGQIHFHVHKTISLYPWLSHPEFSGVKQRRIIFVHHTDGNWLPFSPELKKAIEKQIAELAK